MNKLKTLFSKASFEYIVFLYILVIIILIFNLKNQIKNLKTLQENLKKDITIEIKDINLKAKSFVIYDIKTGKKVISKNETEILPLASLSKVIIISAYLNFKKEKKEEISQQVKNSILKILIESDNEEIESLNLAFEKKYGLDLIQVAEKDLFPKLSITDIKMKNASGLDIDENTPANLGTAESIAKIYANFYLENESFFQDTKFSRQKDIINTNPFASKTYGLLASKTGFTDLAGGNLAIISSPSPGSLYAIVVMNSTKEERFSDIEKLNSILPFVYRIKQN